MNTNAVLPNCKTEEIPVIGQFVLDTVQRDLPDFTAAAPDIDQAYLDNIVTKQGVINALVTRAEKTGELKGVTQSLYGRMDSLKPKLDLLEIKLKRASGQLAKPIAEFGLPKLRANIKKRNAEATIAALAVLLREIDTNTLALEAKGFTAAMRQEFVDNRTFIDSHNRLQNTLINQSSELTADNKALLLDYWRSIAELLGIGKLIYKNDPVKAKEYTFTNLRTRVRRENKKAVPGSGAVASEGGGVVGG
jgi:hypothetical protein